MDDCQNSLWNVRLRGRHKLRRAGASEWSAFFETVCRVLFSSIAFGDCFFFLYFLVSGNGRLPSPCTGPMDIKYLSNIATTTFTGQQVPAATLSTISVAPLSTPSVNVLPPRSPSSLALPSSLSGITTFIPCTSHSHTGHFSTAYRTMIGTEIFINRILPDRSASLLKGSNIRTQRGNFVSNGYHYC